MTEAVPYRIPKEPGRWRALLLAALVHAVLIGFLWFGVSWQNENTVAIEAEVWDVQVKEAAPAPRVVEPKPEPVPVTPEPKIVEPPPPKVVEAPRVVTPPEPKPDIALEQEKKRKEAERAEQERQQKLAEQKRQEELAEKKRQEQLAEQKRLDEQKRAEAEARKRKEEEQRKLAEKKRREEAEALAAEKRHQETLKRLQEQAGGSGDAARAQGPRSADPTYAQRVGAKIKSNTVFSVLPGLAGNPAVEYDVQLLPDGSVRGIRKLRSSGVPGFDEAVARAIERSQPFPPDQRTGAVPSGFTVMHRPKDQ